MPYLGQSQLQEGGGGGEDQPPQYIRPEWSHVRRLPGVLVILQLGCSFMGFLLAVAGTAMAGRVTSYAYGIFIFFAFCACFSCFMYLALRVLSIHVIFFRRPYDMNWNILGLAHSGASVFLMMIGSCFMVEHAGRVRLLRAAGVFGFLGYTGFLAQLIFELLAWRKARGDSLLPSFATATVVRGRNRRGSSTSSKEESRGEMVRGEVALRDHDGDDEDGTVGFVGMKQRPVSSFLQSNPEVITPTLYAPGFDKEEANTKENAATIHEERGEEEVEDDSDDDEASKMMNAQEEVGGKQKEEEGGGGVKAKKQGKQKEEGRNPMNEDSDDDDNLVTVRTSSGSSSSSQGGEWQVPL